MKEDIKIWRKIGKMLLVELSFNERVSYETVLKEKERLGLKFCSKEIKKCLWHENHDQYKKEAEESSRIFNAYCKGEKTPEPEKVHQPEPRYFVFGISEYEHDSTPMSVRMDYIGGGNTFLNCVFNEEVFGPGKFVFMIPEKEEFSS